MVEFQKSLKNNRYLVLGSTLSPKRCRWSLIFAYLKISTLVLFANLVGNFCTMIKEFGFNYSDINMVIQKISLIIELDLLILRPRKVFIFLKIFSKLVHVSKLETINLLVFEKTFGCFGQMILNSRFLFYPLINYIGIPPKFMIFLTVKIMIGIMNFFIILEIILCVLTFF